MAPFGCFDEGGKPVDRPLQPAHRSVVSHGHAGQWYRHTPSTAPAGTCLWSPIVSSGGLPNFCRRTRVVLIERYPMVIIVSQLSITWRCS